MIPHIHPELEHLIQSTPMVDTHEHQKSEEDWIENGPVDVLADLVLTYVSGDMHCAAGGLDVYTANRLAQTSVAERWDDIKDTWQNIRGTGFGEAMAIQAREVYGIDEITSDALEAAQPILDGLRRPGERRRFMEDVANLECAVIDGEVPLPVDSGGPDYFLHDITWWGISSGKPDTKWLHKHTGIEVHDLASFRHALNGLVDRYAAFAPGIKSQHVYDRTLRWEPREDGDAERALQKYLRGVALSESERLCLGDWGWSRGIELSIEYDLAFKMHTGYLAGVDRTVVDGIRAGHLCKLAMAYPDARLVCMHMSYPYESELIALAKQFRNIYVDMCWAWALNPQASAQFVRKYLHGAAANKLFAFGADTTSPTAALAYAVQTRRWLGHALSSEVSDGFMSLERAMKLARGLMAGNPHECYRLENVRSAIKAEYGTT
jgi:uncharacterized protein